jgi:hypothetical protein
LGTEKVAIIEPFQAQEQIMKVAMFAMRTNLYLAIPWSLNKWMGPFSKHEKLP